MSRLMRVLLITVFVLVFANYPAMAALQWCPAGTPPGLIAGEGSFSQGEANTNALTVNPDLHEVHPGLGNTAVNDNATNPSGIDFTNNGDGGTNDPRGTGYGSTKNAPEKSE